MASAGNIITKNLVVELRELNANQNTTSANAGANTTGDYSVTLPTDIDLEEGDVVGVQSVFIDDDGENNNAIIIEEDINDGFISCYMYHMDNNTSQTDENTTSAGRVGGRTLGDERTYHPAFEATPANRVHPDGELYFLSSIDDANTGTGVTVSTISFRVNMLQNRGNPVPLFFKYTTPAGQVIKKVIVWDYKTINKIQSSEGIITVSNDLMARANKKESDSFQFPFDALNSASVAFDFTDKSIKQMQNGGIETGSAITNTSEAITAGHKCSLINKTVNFSLKAGAYTPEHIAQVITDQIVKISPTGFITGAGEQRFTNNDFFTTSLDLKAIGDKADGSRADTKPFFIRSDGARALQFDDTDIGGGVLRNYWCGASNFGLSYDGLRFAFTNLHNSIYSQHKPAVVGTRVGNRADTNLQYLANKNSGICFNQLFPPDLWFNKLGFRRDMLVHPKKITCAWTLPGTHPGNGQNPVGNVGFTAASGAGDLDNRIIEGVNATGDLNAVDVMVVKNDAPDAARGNGAYDRPGDTGLLGVNTNVSAEISVLAGELNQTEEGRSYYQIEIDMNIPSEKLGANQYNNKIQAIVGRYFATANGTQAVQGEGAIEYTHKGQPIKLSNFRVRILNPDGSLARVGEDNTVFLQITKAK